MFHNFDFTDFLDSSLEVAELLLPVAIVFYILRYMDYRADTPKYQDLSNWQKIWLFLHSLKAEFAAKVGVALGDEFMIPCLAEAAKLPEYSQRLTVKVRREFARVAGNLPDNEDLNFAEIKSLNIENETIWSNYKDDIPKLVADILEVWPCSEEDENKTDLGEDEKVEELVEQ